MNFKPMLSADLAKVDNDFEKVRCPVLVSPKLDGVRCIVWEGVAYSRNAKPIPNKFVQDWAAHHHNLDGELIVGSPTEGEVLGRTLSGVKSAEGEPDFRFHLFDCVEANFDGAGFAHRLDFVQGECGGEDRIVNVPHRAARTGEEIRRFEKEFLDQGYEGIMLRAPDGPYKHGRSTLREGWLIKVKRFIDGEAVVIALEEAELNTNEAKIDELGRTKRSSAKAGKTGKGMVGTIVVRDPKWGELRLSPGVMTHADRVEYWYQYAVAEGMKSIIGRTVHWRAFGYGLKDKPRFARFYGFPL